RSGALRGDRALPGVARAGGGQPGVLSQPERPGARSDPVARRARARGALLRSGVGRRSVRMSGVVVWFTGLPRAGKSTLAAALQASLERYRCESVLLDGDALRAALSPPPGYDATSREQLYATLANLAALIARQGRVVLVAATAHRRAFRDRAR